MGIIIFLFIVVAFCICSFILSLKESNGTKQRGVSNNSEEEMTEEQMIAEDYYYYRDED